jgi:hypothetical protein
LLVKKRAELKELDNLRNLNNELEQAHIELESQLYTECDLKDEVIHELTSRYSALHAKLVQTEQYVELLRERKTVDPSQSFFEISTEQYRHQVSGLEQKCKGLQSLAELRQNELNHLNSQIRVLFAAVGEKDSSEEFCWLMQLRRIRTSLECLVNVLKDCIRSSDDKSYLSSFVLAIGTVLPSCGMMEEALKLGHIKVPDLPLDSFEDLSALVDKLIASEESLGHALPIMEKISKTIESSATRIVNSKMPHELDATFCLLHVFPLYEMAIQHEFAALKPMDSGEKEVTQFYQFMGALNSILHPFTLMANASRRRIEGPVERLIPVEAWNELVSLVDILKSLYIEIMRAKEALFQDAGSSKYPFLQDVKTALCDATFGDKTIFASLCDLEAHFSTWIQNLPARITLGGNAPRWRRNIADIKQKIQSIEQFSIKITDLEIRLSTQIQMNAQKDEELGQLQLLIERLEKSKINSDDIHKLEKELQEMTELKEKYEKGLEMMHADFEESNQEYEQLSKQYQALQLHLKQRSPGRMIHSDAIDQAPVDVYIIDIAINSLVYH